MTSVTAVEIMASDNIDINTRMTDKVGTGPGPDFSARSARVLFSRLRRRDGKTAPTGRDIIDPANQPRRPHEAGGKAIGVKMQMSDGVVGFAQLARVPLVVLANTRTRRCPPTKIRRPRHCGLSTCDSERDIDMVNSQICLLVSRSLSWSDCVLFPPAGCDTNPSEGRTWRREVERRNPFLAHDFGFSPGLAQFVTSPTYVGVIGAQLVPALKELMLNVRIEGDLMHSIPCSNTIGAVKVFHPHFTPSASRNCRVQARISGSAIIERPFPVVPCLVMSPSRALGGNPLFVTTYNDLLHSQPSAESNLAWPDVMRFDAMERT
ncbi:hypothetical protein QBC45DRAFT_462402 [Copromyces sp. CBS 386.78]|nr:hypothetical protein QBC45DRAFT_462402 [Copromyces sp. CBS 386.78]